jgi:hypothetical protein
MSDALRAVNVNIEAICCTQRDSTTTVHLIVNDVDEARAALKTLGKVTTEEVFTFVMKDKPGTIFSIARACAGAGVNIRNIYATTHQKEGKAAIYLLVDDIEKASRVFES